MAKRLFSEKEINQLRVMAGLHMPVAHMCSILGVTTNVLYARISDQAGVKDALYKGRAESSLRVRRKAFDMAVSGHHPTMTQFWLRTKEGFIDPDKVKADSTPQRRPLNVNYLPKSEREQRAREIDEFEKELFGERGMIIDAEFEKKKTK